MTTRFNAKDEVNYGVQGVKSGYDGQRSDLFIPSCGVEDVDASLFNLFDKEIKFEVGGQDSAELKKVPVIFAAGEKWALLKKGRPIRDKNNSLILPLITIMRTQIGQDTSRDIAGRGINQQTGEIVVTRRLASSDRNYQNLINKLLIEKQSNVAVNPVSGSAVSDSSQLYTSRRVGSLSGNRQVHDGAFLLPNRKNNVYETIVVPSPQFYTATYEVVIWAQYMQHMNQILEKLISSFLPQAQSWKLTTPKGYWFIASVEGGSFNIESNFDDMSSAERFIKHKFTLTVPAYIWASSAPGTPIPVKRYISSPIINFQLATRSLSEGGQEKLSTDPKLIGSDDPTLPLDETANVRSDQRRPGWRVQRVQPYPGGIDKNDPALISRPDPELREFPRGSQPGVKIIDVNPSTGETVFTTSDFDGLKIIVVDK
jgi:hypothetical protein